MDAQDPFLVFTSRIFALLGLHSLYFVLASFMNRFAYLKIGLGMVLGFAGGKMLLLTGTKSDRTFNRNHRQPARRFDSGVLAETGILPFLR